MPSPSPDPSQAQALGKYLASLRTAKGYTLREVEDATGKEVSNAYLSQLEHGRINKPSPNVLHSLASVYGAAYEKLMEKAGYITPLAEHSQGTKHGRAATFAIGDITEEEEEALLAYLAFYRQRKEEK